MDILAASAAATKTEDLTKPQEGGFTREIPEAGAALLRLNSYLEMGTHQPNNKTWKPAVLVKLTFELLHPKHMIKPEGKPAFPQTLTIDVWKAGKGSRYDKLFKAMNYDGSHQHFDTMIGKTPFLGKLTHRVVGEGKDKKTYVNLTDDLGNWTIGVPAVEDPMTEEVKKVPIPEMNQPGKLFLWNQDGWSDELYTAAWKQLYIDTPEGADDKNWIQNRIREAIDFSGSRIDEVLQKESLDVKQVLTADEPPEEPTDSEADDLAALGLL